MRTKSLIRTAVGVGVVAAAVFLNGRRVRRAAERRADALLEASRSVEPDDASLPAPVRRYLETVLPADPPTPRAVRVRQRGRLRLGDAASPWKPFTATQHVAVAPPGFVWNASIRLAPLPSLRILDAFEEGDGTARVYLCSFPVGGADPTPELNEAELARYLAEAVWYPAALAGEYVEWEARDDASAEATITYRGTSASLVFHFDDRNLVSHVSTDGRYRRVGDGYELTPWTGHWRDYRTWGGVRVPTAGEVVWHPPGGAFSAWRGRVTALTYDPAV